MQNASPDSSGPLPTPGDGSSNSDTPGLSVPSLKRHAACDECRKKKLKCSGEMTGCSRCVKQSLVCHYSIQKQMGRPPKKRAREDDGDVGLFGIPDGSDMLPEFSESLYGLSGLDPETAPMPDSSYLCPPVYTAPFSRPQAFLSTDENHNHSWQTDAGKFSTPLPATTSPWPDFSSVSAATSCMVSLPPALSHMSQMASPPLTPENNDSSDNQCACLHYLYLCLSHLSSLAPFPISQHTVCSLFIGAKTARMVLRCEVCPLNFATAMQNVMFTGTLLNVLGDSWLRVSKADAIELGKQAAPPEYVSEVTKNSPDPAETWKDWLRQTVRSGVTGLPADPAGTVKCADSPSLLSLVEEMETRQRRWHTDRPPHYPPVVGTNSSKEWTEQRNEQDMLCIRVAKSARDVIAKFDFQPNEFPEGTAL
ncbi:C6 finger domain protein [Aspergillus ambiguus]|uniref:Zn(II)2Cys6 transcription factor rglT n=1 Tax=Aspergillus ambiguus TaxID=176160 RepID=UPI003CCD97C9